MSKVAAVFLFLGFFLASASGQTTTGTVVGRAADESDGIIAGARVTAVNSGNNHQRTVVTNDSGNYTIPDLPVGSYRIEAEFKGFRTLVVKGVTIEAGGRTLINLGFIPGPVTEFIEVEAESSLNTDEATVGGSISGPAILRLPLNGRHYETLAQLIAGVLLPVSGSPLSSRGGLNGIGTAENFNLFLLDGVGNGDPVIRSWAFRPSIDQIQEFKVLQAGAPAEFGRSAGLVISATTRAGSNQFHGTMWEFLRNDNFDARNYFAPADQPKPSFIRNQFGATLGGPVFKDRTFFFGSYEGLRSREGLSRLATVPTELMRAGDLSELDASSVPPGETHPLTIELMQAFPLPNLPGTRGNRSETANRVENANDYSIRIDHGLFENTWIFGRFSSSVARVLDPFRNEAGISTNLAGFGQTADRFRTSAGFSAITATHGIVNEVRVGYSRVRQPVTPLHAATPGQEPLSGFQKTFLNFAISGFEPLGSGAEFKRAVNVYHYIDTVSFGAGNHHLKAGVDIRRYLFNSYAVSPNSFTFNGTRTGSAMGDFLRGLPGISISFTGSPGGNAQKTEVAWFIQDDWKASRRLTVSYGVRWEYYGRILEKNNKQSLWLPECNCMKVAGDGLPRQLVDNDFNNFAPRLGLVFRPFADGKTILRASAGIYYDNDMRHNTEVIMNPPFFETRVFVGLLTPTLSFDNPFPASGIPTLNPVTLDRRYRDSYAEIWSFGVQRELARRTVVDLTYIGNHVLKMRRVRNLNQSVNGVPPFPGYFRIIGFEQAGSSNSNALQARVERRFDGGLGFMSSYTWSHAIDDRPNQGGFWHQDSFNVRADRADADFDVRHRWTVSGVWEAPFGAGRRWGNNWTGLQQALFGGWGVSVIGITQSGRPLSVTLDADNSRSGNFADRPNTVADVHWKPQDQGPDQWINPAAFSIAPEGTFGALGRNTIRGPGFQTIDIGFAKNQPVGESARLQFRTELFNAFNHPNFAPPSTKLNGPSAFGLISATAGPQRQIQFGIRLEY